MNSANVLSFPNQVDTFDVINQRVLKIWEAVFKASNTVLRHAERYGFHGIEVIPNPNIHEMLVQIELVEKGLSAIVETGTKGLGFSEDEVRLALNADEQVKRMRRVAAALLAGDADAFEEAISELERQAAF